MRSNVILPDIQIVLKFRSDHFGPLTRTFSPLSIVAVCVWPFIPCASFSMRPRTRMLRSANGCRVGSLPMQRVPGAQRYWTTLPRTVTFAPSRPVSPSL
jgi:hypothetical protein